MAGDRCRWSGQEIRPNGRQIAACWCGAIVPIIRIPSPDGAVTVAAAHEVPCLHVWEDSTVGPVCASCGTHRNRLPA